MKHMAQSRKDRNKVSDRGRKTERKYTFFCPLFDVIGRFWALHCKMQANCKQQRLLTRKTDSKATN